MSSSLRVDLAAPRSWTPRRWSLRTRLLVGQITLLAFVCIVIGTVTGVAMQRFLVGQLDGQLLDAGHRSSAMSYGGQQPPGPPPSHSGPGPDFIGAPGQPAGTVGAIVDSGSVTSAGVLTNSGTSTSVSSAATAELAAVPADGSPYTRTLDGLGQYRLLATRTPSGQVIVTGLSLSDVDATLVRVVLIFTVVSLLALLAATAAGIAVIRRAMQPLTKVSATVREVVDLKLDSGDAALSVRVPDSDFDPRTEVGQLSSAVNRMLEHIAAALSARHSSETRVRQFVADASHELRTPLTAIKGYTELARRADTDVPESVSHAMTRVGSEADRMTHLVEDLLLLARLDSGRPLEQESVDLTRLAVDAVSDAHIAAPEHHWELNLPHKPVLVSGDSSRLHQVLANLLANARTHTGPGTSVVTSVAVDANDAVLTVLDDGPGIPPRLVGDVFERFARGDSSRSRKAGSTGLGLAIADSVMVAHRGSIAVESAPGRTEFTVRLPIDGFTARA